MPRVPATQETADEAGRFPAANSSSNCTVPADRNGSTWSFSADPGNRWIIVATDYLTRYAETKALPSGTAVEVAKFFIESIVLRHGAPEVLITDRGSSFMAQLTQEILRLSDTSHRRTTAYHPQTNGLTKRLNKTIADMISMYVDVEHKTWDEVLPYVTFAYNTAVQETTGFTPFQLVHGRKVTTMLDAVLPHEPADNESDDAQVVAQRAEEARQLARLFSVVSFTRTGQVGRIPLLAAVLFGRVMERSSGAAITASDGRGKSVQAAVPRDYAVVLPPLSTGVSMKCSLVLHCDTSGRPYRAEDFVRPLEQAGLLPDVAGLGVYQMNHVWLLKLRSPEAKEKLLSAGTIEVKGKCCLVIDPNRREIRVKIHWVAFDAPLDAIRRAFEPYGVFKEVVRDVWKINGLLNAESTTLTVVMTLRQDLSEDSLPHQLRFFGGMVLVVVPGRAPICLRCRCKGHVRRDCKTPRCTECRGFGHVDKDCAKTYAGAAAKNGGNDVNDMVMDEAEAEEAASSTTKAREIRAFPEPVTGMQHEQPPFKKKLG
ncbi:hypothetical protein ISCGN_022783 [Ixodes scapularis]